MAQKTRIAYLGQSNEKPHSNWIFLRLSPVAGICSALRLGDFILYRFCHKPWQFFRSNPLLSRWSPFIQLLFHPIGSSSIQIYLLSRRRRFIFMSLKLHHKEELLTGQNKSYTEWTWNGFTTAWGGLIATEIMNVIKSQENGLVAENNLKFKLCSSHPRLKIGWI